MCILQQSLIRYRAWSEVTVGTNQFLLSTNFWSNVVNKVWFFITGNFLKFQENFPTGQLIQAIANNRARNAKRTHVQERYKHFYCTDFSDFVQGFGGLKCILVFFTKPNLFCFIASYLCITYKLKNKNQSVCVFKEKSHW